MNLTERRRAGDRQLEEPGDLQGAAEMPVERLSARVLQNQHHRMAVGNELKRRNSPRAIQLVLQSEFVCEALDACGPRPLRRQPQDQNAGRRFEFASPLPATERAFAIRPQLLELDVRGIERGLRLHSSRSTVWRCTLRRPYAASKPAVLIGSGGPGGLDFARLPSFYTIAPLTTLLIR